MQLFGTSAFIEGAKERYDYIILDAPTFLAVTDSMLLSRLANIVLVVMEAGRMPAMVVRHLQESLQSCEAPVSGVVLNNKAATKNWLQKLINRFRDKKLSPRLQGTNFTK